MKKIFTLIAAVAFAATVSAQQIVFTEATEKGAVPETFEKNGFVLTTVDTDKSKHQIDANTAYFGTADSYVKFEMRLKTGGKSSSKNALKLTLPADGVVKVYARTGSNSALDRNVVLKQSDAELYNELLLESDAVKAVIGGEEKNVYPVISVSAKAGDVNVEYPVNSVNFYGFEFVSSDGVSHVIAPVADGDIYNLSGMRVSSGTKGVVIRNGHKFVNAK